MADRPPEAFLRPRLRPGDEDRVVCVHFFLSSKWAPRDRALRVDQPDDPRLAAYLAEAIARIDPARTPEAHATLRDLATRDLIGDPLSWVALASLEQDAEARELIASMNDLAPAAASVS